MKPFKLPIIATGIVFLSMVIVGILSIVLIHNSSLTSHKKAQRASLAGAAVATVGCVVIAPFWFVAAAKVGKERREKKRLG